MFDEDEEETGDELDFHDDFLDDPDALDALEDEDDEEFEDGLDDEDDDDFEDD